MNKFCVGLLPERSVIESIEEIDKVINKNCHIVEQSTDMAVLLCSNILYKYMH